jgi:hypothetical protein
MIDKSYGLRDNTKNELVAIGLFSTCPSITCFGARLKDQHIYQVVDIDVDILGPTRSLFGAFRVSGGKPQKWDVAAEQKRKQDSDDWSY